MIKLDALDLKILALLQEDASRSMEEMARELGASKTPVWYRVKKMRDMGVITRDVSILNASALGLDSVFFVMIKTSEHEQSWQESFLEVLRDTPEVVEAHRMAGEIDYILKVVVENARAFDAFYQKLIKAVRLFSVTSTLSMEVIKSTTALPCPKPRRDSLA